MRLFTRRSKWTGSVDDLLVNLSRSWTYGNAHDPLTSRERLRLARNEPVSATCTPLSVDLATLLRDHGFPARAVLVFTREEPNEIDNGHTLLEIRTDDGWKLYDPSFRTFFTRRGTRLSLLEWSRAVQDGDYEIEDLGEGAPLGTFQDGSAALRERMERLVADEEERRRWYRRIAGVPLVHAGNGHWVFSADDPLAPALTAYSSSYRPLDPADFSALWPN